MDELFGEVGFAQADKERKERIERDVGLTALLDGSDTMGDGKSDAGSGSDKRNGEFVEKAN